MNESIILIECTDRTGLINDVARILSGMGANIVSNHEFVSPEKVFFMRTKIEGKVDRESVKMGLKNALPDGAKVSIREKRRKSIVIMVTKEAHCLGDLLIRHYADELSADISAVIGNHEVLAPLVENFGIPFHFVDHRGLGREAHEQKILDILGQYDLDYLVLAKYMRILTPDFISKYKHKIINIHHSFLPAFIGANPYRKAYDRGVKIIGATSHFVTDDLDEGPIIAQSVTPVNHEYSPKNMAQAGRDVEKLVLSTAVRLVLQDRVFIHKNKTVVFD